MQIVSIVCDEMYNVGTGITVILLDRKGPKLEGINRRNGGEMVLGESGLSTLPKEGLGGGWKKLCSL